MPLRFLAFLLDRQARTAFVFDILTVAVPAGYLLGHFFGHVDDEGFQLSGWPALLLPVLLVAYFLIARRLGGTIWQRILGTGR